MGRSPIESWQQPRAVQTTETQLLQATFALLQLCASKHTHSEKTTLDSEGQLVGYVIAQLAQITLDELETIPGSETVLHEFDSLSKTESTSLLHVLNAASIWTVAELPAQIQLSERSEYPQVRFGTQSVPLRPEVFRTGPLREGSTPPSVELDTAVYRALYAFLSAYTAYERSKMPAVGKVASAAPTVSSERVEVTEKEPTWKGLFTGLSKVELHVIADPLERRKDPGLNYLHIEKVPQGNPDLSLMVYLTGHNWFLLMKEAGYPLSQNNVLDEVRIQSIPNEARFWLLEAFWKIAQRKWFSSVSKFYAFASHAKYLRIEKVDVQGIRIKLIF